MEKTSHWAALYFVTLMTFGNYVLFNLLVAILVEGFSSERHERREREQREQIKAKLNAEQQQLQMQLQMQEQFNEMFPQDDLKSFSDSTTSDSYNELRNRWFSAEELRKLNNVDVKCNIQKQKLLQGETTDVVDGQMPTYLSKSNQEKEKHHRSESHKRRHHGSVRDKSKSEKSKHNKREAPTITTTAATPQDSPNNTMEMGTRLRDWKQIDMEQLEVIVSFCHEI
jgi:voltage-dependent calcium channel T type alpha-1G